MAGRRSVETSGISGPLKVFDGKVQVLVQQFENLLRRSGTVCTRLVDILVCHRLDIQPDTVIGSVKQEIGLRPETFGLGKYGPQLFGIFKLAAGIDDFVAAAYNLVHNLPHVAYL